ncbi:MAG TPA: cytochrome c oxidase assembly protein [Puia sp.]|jgi:cytochrome c oxidase assembly factor CtaG
MRRLFYITGILLALLCLAAPAPATLSGYPFSLHMLRHTLLLLVAAPLIALSITRNNSLRKPLAGLSRLGFRLPFLAWITGVGLMWVWHIPTLYNSMPMQGMGQMSNSLFHPLSVIHACSMLVGGFLFCWPVLTPFSEYRLPALKAVLYLSAACVFCSLSGLLITFAPAGTFMDASADDQQTGGLIMWVPCCFIYLSASMYLLIRWFSQKEEIPFIQPIKN